MQQAVAAEAGAVAGGGRRGKGDMECSKCNSSVIKRTKTVVGSGSGGNMKSTLIEKEMKQLEKIKFKQVTWRLFSKRNLSKPYNMR